MSKPHREQRHKGKTPGVTRWRRTLSRRDVLRLGVGAAIPGLLVMRGTGSVAAEAPRPNVLLITSDDQSKFDVGCYGNEAVQTPATDALAAEGVRFERCYTVSAICVPSRAVMMTGLYPHANGCHGFHQLRPDVRPLTAYLRDAGYRVGLVGKRHLKPWEVYRFEYAPEEKTKTRDPVPYQQWVRGFFEFLKASGPAEPFFLMVNFHDPHRPFPIPGTKKGLTAEVPDPIDRGKVKIHPTLFDVPDVREEEGRYFDAIHRMDRALGLVFAELDAAGHADDTLVIFLGDNGGAFPFSKATQYEAGINMPCIMRWPGVMRPDTVSDALLSFIDVTPTILELAGIRIPGDMHGESFAPLLLGRTEKHRDVFFGSQTDHASQPGTPMRSVIAGHSKYIYNFAPEAKYRMNAMGGLTWKAMVAAAETNERYAERVNQFLHRPQEELYDLSVDPYEQKNLAADDACAAELKAMRRRLVAHMDEIDDPFLAAYSFASDAQKQRMRASYDEYLAFDGARAEARRKRRQ